MEQTYTGATNELCDVDVKIYPGLPEKAILVLPSHPECIPRAGDVIYGQVLKSLLVQVNGLLSVCIAAARTRAFSICSMLQMLCAVTQALS
jgi:hypothetical protein